MTVAQVDMFSSKLTKELGALTWQARSELLISIGKMEIRMRSSGQDRPLWRGPASESELLGADVVVRTEQGERRGRVICFGIMKMPDGIEYERSVVVHVPSSGTHHEAPGSTARFASAEDSERMQNELTMAQRLSEIASSVHHGPTPLANTVARPRRRGEKDPKLVEKMIEAARNSKNVKTLDDGPANFKITGIDPTRRIYVFKSQLRVDVSGFSISHPGIRSISDAEARDMHLGKVRGQVLFEDKTAALAGFEAALELLAG